MTYEKWIDVAKGIGILLVILGHNNFDQSFLTVVHTFNMPLFFFISGYLYHYKKYKLNPKYFVFQKFKRLVVPYLVTNIIILCTYFLLSFLKLSSFNNRTPLRYLVGVFYGNGAPLNPSTIFTNSLSVPSWFLLGLFCASIILYIIAYSHERYGLACSSFLCFLIILFGFKISKYTYLPWSFDIACVSMIFMFSGYLINYYRVRQLQSSFRNNLYSLVFVLLLPFVISINGAVDMNTRTYSNLLFFGIGGLLGTYITIQVAREISKKEDLLTRIFTYLGKNSIIILLYHTFVPIVILNIVDPVFNIKEVIINSPVLYSLTMLVFSIMMIIAIKRVPVLDRVYST